MCMIHFLSHRGIIRFIRRLGSDPEKLFPFDALQDQLRRFGKFGLVMATLMVPIITLEGEKCPDLDEIFEAYARGEPPVSSPIKPDAAVFNKRMRDVIVDLDRLGYF